MSLVSDDETPVVVQPGEEALDLPSADVTLQRASVLRDVSSIRAVRRDHLDSPILPETLVELVTVVGFVADHPVDRIGNECVVESLFDERDLVRRSTCDANGDWKTMRVCDRHDLGSLAPLRLPDGSAPFLAPEKEPSMYVSERSIPPRSWRSLANA